MSSHKQSLSKLKSKIPQSIITILEEEGKGEEKLQQQQKDNTKSSSLSLSKYDEFAAEVVAAENKKKSEQKLKRLIN